MLNIDPMLKEEVAGDACCCRWHVSLQKEIDEYYTKSE